MKDFEVITINIGYFIFDFLSVWDWELSLHLFPIFKKQCECSDTKISQSITSHTRECNFQGSAEKMGFPRENKTNKTQTLIFANLAFSEKVDNKSNLEMLQ